LTETYSDNVELSPINQQSSMVSQLFVGLDGTFKSREIDISFSGTNTTAAYSHDSDLNDNYQAANLDAMFSLWRDGPQLLAASSLSNISQNSANNSLSDLISGDTIQQKVHSAGIQYQTANSAHDFSGRLIYSLTETEDGIGESKGYTANIDSKNGNGARNAFWSLSGQYSDRENSDSSGTSYTVDTQIGAITSFKLNPFIRFYNEDISGSAFNSNRITNNSWGPGLRWQASEHFYLDVSYNYVSDKADSDNYVAASIKWQPSQRTSLIAGYDKRFFGNSYNLDLSHRTKRLTKDITYEESIEIYERYKFEAVDVGEFWCPVGVPFEGNSCFPSAEPPSDTSNFNLVPLSRLEPVTSNGFTLNKSLAWNSTLALSRTTFVFTIASREQEDLETGVINDNLDVNLSANRTLSPRSSVKLLTSYKEAVFDKNFTPDDPQQEDTYKTLSATYNRDLVSSLSAYFTLQYLDRQSSLATLTYDEVRAYINITKDF
jgi:uncharacterized protein (PEP-CTERM system associated)